VVGQGSVIEATASELRKQLPEPVDLCLDCGQLPLDFLRSGHRDHHAVQGSGIPIPLERLVILAGSAV
jgi:hypothetical protein